MAAAQKSQRLIVSGLPDKMRQMQRNDRWEAVAPPLHHGKNSVFVREQSCLFIRLKGTRFAHRSATVDARIVRRAIA
jgi:hypothetical protein